MKTGKVIRNIVAVVLFSFLIIAFAVSGVTQDVLRPVPRDAVVSVNGREVSKNEFKALFDRQREAAKQKVGRALTVEEAVAQQIDRGILQELLDQTIFNEVFDRMGVKASPKVVAESLRQIPDFFDPVTGRFDTKAYQQRIGEQGWSPARFESLMASGIAGDHFTAALQSGFKAPLSFGALQGAMYLESRDASAIFIPPSAVGAVPEPTEAQLSSLMQELSPRLQRPERRELTFVRLSASRYYETAPIDPVAVQKMFDFRKDQAVTPETRTIVQIPVKDQATGQGVVERLTKGEDPAAIAKSVGSNPVTYDAKPKSALPDRKLAEAAFALAEGKTSGVVQGDLGLSVLKVLKVTAGATGQLDKLKTEIEQEVKLRAADAKVSESADKLEDAIGSGATLEAAAAQVGLSPSKTPAIDRGGRPDQGGPVAGLSAKLVEVAFSLPSGATSEFETEQAGEYFLVRVDKIIPPALPPFDEIKADLASAWKIRELDRRLTARANDAAARLRNNEAPEAVAAAVGGQLMKVTDVSRASAPTQAQVYGQELLGGVLQAKKGEVVVTNAPQPGRMVVKVEAIRPGNPNEIAQGVRQARGQFQQLLAQEAVASFAGNARTLVKARSYPDRARSAIGAQPVANAKTDDKSKAKE